MSRLLPAILLTLLLAACAGRPLRSADALPPLRLSPASLQGTLALQ
ncbi:MAG: DUF3261 domain-containing protein, partial [Stenotrophomonas sp.]|nr:DUF3261 domain-containing protein [Stenotrophomonas sp.]